VTVGGGRLLRNEFGCVVYRVALVFRLFWVAGCVEYGAAGCGV